jgi:hypothetical protein
VFKKLTHFIATDKFHCILIVSCRVKKKNKENKLLSMILSKLKKVERKNSAKKKGDLFFLKEASCLSCYTVTQT